LFLLFFSRTYRAPRGSESNFISDELSFLSGDNEDAAVNSEKNGTSSKKPIWKRKKLRSVVLGSRNKSEVNGKAGGKSSATTNGFTGLRQYSTSLKRWNKASPRCSAKKQVAATAAADEGKKSVVTVIVNSVESERQKVVAVAAVAAVAAVVVPVDTDEQTLEESQAAAAACKEKNSRSSKSSEMTTMEETTFNGGEEDEEEEGGDGDLMEEDEADVNALAEPNVAPEQVLPPAANGAAANGHVAAAALNNNVLTSSVPSPPTVASGATALLTSATDPATRNRLHRRRVRVRRKCSVRSLLIVLGDK
jgi:hypothetical protein